jgi:AraC-like DNA-binding protein
MRAEDAGSTAVPGGQGGPEPPPTVPALAINVTEVETVLMRSASLALGKYRCRVDHPRFDGGGPQRCAYIAFPRSSVRITRALGPPLVYTPNTISFHDVGDTYRRSAVSEEGERCDWIAVAPGLLRDIAAQVDAGALDRERIVETPIARSAPGVYLAQRSLFRAVREQRVSVLEFEENAIAIVDAALRAALRPRGDGDGPRRRPRRFAGRAPRIVDDAVALLAEQYRSALGMQEVGQRVFCSPSYLARQFLRRTGFTLHGYQQQLRLRAALELLPQANRDLTGVAVYLGFSSHSHFTSVFHRQFGMTPSEFCRDVSTARVREMCARLFRAA